MAIADMNSSRLLSGALLLFNFYLFFCALEGSSVAAFSQSSPNPQFSFTKLIKEVSQVKLTLAKKGLSALNDTIKKVAASTHQFPKSCKPLTMITTLDDVCLVNQTKKSLKISIVNPITVASITGGALGDDLYLFNSFTLAWKDNRCTGTHNLESAVICYNSKYGSYENALNYRNGIALIVFPVGTNGNFSNPKFDKFSESLAWLSKDGGNHFLSKSSYTYLWFATFPYHSVYHTYEIEYQDPDTGKKTTAMVLYLPSDPRGNYISEKQYKESFSSMSPSFGVFYERPSGSGSTTQESHKGIHVLYVPS